MGKLLTWVLIAAVVWLVWQLVTVSRRRGQRAAGDAEAAAARANDPERIERCAHCGVYLPASQARRDGERWYCSADHLAAARRGESR